MREYLPVDAVVSWVVSIVGDHPDSGVGTDQRCLQRSSGASTGSVGSSEARLIAGRLDGSGQRTGNGSPVSVNAGRQMFADDDVIVVREFPSYIEVWSVRR